MLMKSQKCLLLIHIYRYGFRTMSAQTEKTETKGQQMINLTIDGNPVAVPKAQLSIKPHGN